MWTTGPLGGGGARDLEEPTINARKRQRRGPLAGADGDPGGSTINIKKHQQWAP
jgi:hypothetical protein